MKQRIFSLLVLMLVAVSGAWAQGKTYTVTVSYDDPDGAGGYDLQGRRIQNPRKGGLYIINGKKVVYQLARGASIEKPVPAYKTTGASIEKLVPAYKTTGASI